MKSNASVSVDFLFALNEYAIKHGININEIYRDTGFNFQHTIKNNLRTPVIQFNHLWKTVLEKSEDDNFGLHVVLNSISYQKKNDILLSILFNCNNIEHAIKNLIRYHDITSDLIKIRFYIRNSNAVLTWNSFAIIERDRHYSESIMAMLAFSLFTLSDNTIKIKEISFINDKPNNIKEQIQVFKCRLHFGKSANELVFDKKGLSLPINHPNKELLALLEKYATGLLSRLKSNSSLTEEVYHLINTMLSKGETPCIKKVAGEMALSVRNLQLKLRKEKTSYKIILENLRKEISLEYLRKPDAVIYELAFILGFSEQSSFNHAFKKWVGIKPREYQLKNK